MGRDKKSFSTGFTVSGQIRGFDGTWNLNPEKATEPHARSEILTFRITSAEEHYTVDEVEQDGSPFKTEYAAEFDGKDYPNHNLVTGATTYVCLKIIDDTTKELEFFNVFNLANLVGFSFARDSVAQHLRSNTSGLGKLASACRPHGVVWLAR